MEFIKRNKEYFIWLCVSICVFFLNDTEKQGDIQVFAMMAINIIYAIVTIVYRKRIFSFGKIHK